MWPKLKIQKAKNINKVYNVRSLEGLDILRTEILVRFTIVPSFS